MSIAANISLIDEISSTEFLLGAWKRLNKINKSSKGLSGISIQDFSNSLDKSLKTISHQLKSGTYTFSNVRGVALPKKNKSEIRPLRVAEIKDRIVQKALAIRLEEILTPSFKLDNECSFAYQKGRNVEEAIKKMIEYYNAGYKIILEADIKKFFDTVNRESLLKKIESHLPDNTLHELITASIHQEIGNLHELKTYEEYFQTSENGIPQGNALSPLFANVYLSDFDQRIISQDLKMIRYADDFIIMCKNYKDANNAFDISKNELEDNLKLELHQLETSENINAKTRILNPMQHKFSFLSIRFDGTRCWVNEKKLEGLIEKIKEITEVEKLIAEKKFYGLLPLMIKLKNLLEGWIAAFYFVDIKSQITEVDKIVNRQLYLVMKSLDFELNKKRLKQISLKNKSNEIWALSSIQRQNIGIPSCLKIWETLKQSALI